MKKTTFKRFLNGFGVCSVFLLLFVSQSQSFAQNLSGKASNKSLAVVQTVVGNQVTLTPFYGGLTFIPNVGFDMRVLGKKIENSPLNSADMVVDHVDYGRARFTANQMTDYSRKNFFTSQKAAVIQSTMAAWMQQNGVSSGVFVFQQDVEPKRGDEAGYEAGAKAFRTVDGYPSCEAPTDANYPFVSVDCSVPDAASKGLCFKKVSNCQAGAQKDGSGKPCFVVPSACNGCDSTDPNKKANSPVCGGGAAGGALGPGQPGVSAGANAKLVWQLIISPTGQALYGNPKVVGTEDRTAYVSYISNGVDVRLNQAWKDAEGGLMRWIEKKIDGTDDSDLFSVQTGGAYDETPDAGSENSLDNDGLYCLANHDWPKRTPGATKVCNRNFPDAVSIMNKAGAKGIVIDYVRKTQPQNKLQTRDGEAEDVANFLVLRYDQRIQTTNTHMNMTCVTTMTKDGPVKTCSPPVFGCRDRTYSNAGSRQLRLNQITDRYVYSSGDILPVLVNRAERQMDSPVETFSDMMFVPVTTEMDNYLFNPFDTKFTEDGKRLLLYQGSADSVDTTARIRPAPKDYFVAPVTKQTATFIHEKAPGGADYVCNPGSM